MDQLYVVLNQEWGTSRHLGTPYVKITMVGIHDRNEYTTYVDTPNHNYRNWQHIIQHPERGYVLRNLKIKTHRGRQLINADSKPLIEVEDESLDPILDIVQEFWQRQDRGGPNRFWEIV
jgi:hypothetical protein